MNKHTKTASLAQTQVLFNIIFSGVVVAACVAYIFTANYIVGRRYAIRTERSRLVEQAAIAASQIHDMNELIAYTQAQGMVEAKLADTVFVEAGVALNSR